MPIYMKFLDDSIKGDVTADGHAEWMELNSLQFGVGRGIGSPTGNAKNREASAPSVSEVTVSRGADKASVNLFQEALVGTGKNLQIDFVRTNAGTLVTYCVITLTNVMISGYSISSGGDTPSESLSFNFTKVEYKFTNQTDAGAEGEPIACTYDLALGKKI